VRWRAALAAATLVAAAAFAPPATAATSGDLLTIGGVVGTGPATSIAVNPRGLAVTADAVYLADQRNSVIRKVDRATGVASVVAGTAALGFAGDGGAGTVASVNGPADVEAYGNTLYIADSLNNRVRALSLTSGVITTVAGDGSTTSTGDGGLATVASVRNPSGIAVDTAGNLFISEPNVNKIRKVAAGTGVISTFATPTGPVGVDTDSAGNVYVATGSGHTVLRYPAAGGAATTIAGTGTAGSSGDGGLATSAKVNNPYGVSLDASDNVYISDTSNHKVRMVSAGTGIISTIAGTGAAGLTGDGGAPTAATLTYPSDTVVASDGTIYVTSFSTASTTPVNSAVRKISSNVISTFAGNGWFGFSGDGGPVADAQFDHPAGMARDPAGNLYVADSYNNRIRRITPGGVVTTVAGSGTACTSGCTTAVSVKDGQPATDALLSRPTNVAVDAAGNLYISDTVHHRIRRVDVTTGLISTIAGTGGTTFGGDGGPATAAVISAPQGILVSADGTTVTFTDSAHFRVRQFTVGGTISTIAGTGAQGRLDGDALTTATLYQPMDIVFGLDGSLFIADGAGNEIRKLSNGTVSTIAGSSTAGTSGDGGLATSAKLSNAGSLAIDAAGNLYSADVSASSGLIRRIDRNGVISNIAGTAVTSAPYTGNGVSTGSRLFAPAGLIFDAAGNLYITDQNAQRIRMLSRATTMAGWWVSSYLQSAANVSYAYDLTTVTAATVGSVVATVPSGVAGTPTVSAVYGVPAGGTVARSGTTITYTLPAPVAVPAGVHLYLRFGGLTNPSTSVGAGGVSTVDNTGTVVDSAGTNSISFTTSGTAYSPATPRTAALSPPASVTLTLSPAGAGQADRTVVRSWSIVSTAPKGYTLTQQSSGFTSTDGALSPISTGTATAVTSASVPVNTFGYMVTMTSSSGTVVGALAGSKYAGFSATPEQIVGATVAAPADTVNLTMRGKINYLTRPGTYTGTVTYTLTPSY
jgi:sugar lactone lactonase YvrE